MSALLSTIEIDGHVWAALSSMGEIFIDFGDNESGCIAHGVSVEGRRYFVKHVVGPRGAEAQARAIAVHGAVRHPTLVPLLHVIRGCKGPILVYPWIDGERLRRNRLTAQLPLSEVLDAVEAIIDVHVAIERAGFVSIDLYDGNLLYSDRIHLIDIDEYERAPFRLTAERTLGSTRFMAPEEFSRGSILDSRTMVFQLGRAAAVLLDPPEGATLERTPALAPLVARATMPDPEARYQTVAELAKAWRRKRSGRILNPGSEP